MPQNALIGRGRANAFIEHPGNRYGAGIYSCPICQYPRLHVSRSKGRQRTLTQPIGKKLRILDSEQSMETGQAFWKLFFALWVDKPKQQRR